MIFQSVNKAEIMLLSNLTLLINHSRINQLSSFQSLADINITK